MPLYEVQIVSGRPESHKHTHEDIFIDEEEKSRNFFLRNSKFEPKSIHHNEKWQNKLTVHSKLLLKFTAHIQSHTRILYM